MRFSVFDCVNCKKIESIRVTQSRPAGNEVKFTKCPICKKVRDVRKVLPLCVSDSYIDSINFVIDITKKRKVKTE